MFENGCFLRRQKRFKLPNKESNGSRSRKTLKHHHERQFKGSRESATQFQPQQQQMLLGEQEEPHLDNDVFDVNEDDGGRGFSTSDKFEHSTNESTSGDHRSSSAINVKIEEMHRCLSPSEKIHEAASSSIKVSDGDQSSVIAATAACFSPTKVALNSATSRGADMDNVNGNDDVSDSHQAHLGMPISAARDDHTQQLLQQHQHLFGSVISSTTSSMAGAVISSPPSIATTQATSVISAVGQVNPPYQQQYPSAAAFTHFYSTNGSDMGLPPTAFSINNLMDSRLLDYYNSTVYAPHGISTNTINPLAATMTDYSLPYQQHTLYR